MINKKVIAYLEKIGLPHEILNHKTVYTAYDKAQTLGLKIEQIVKALIVKAGKQYHLVLLPAHQMLDLKKLTKALANGEVKIVGEKAVLELLAQKIGALHSFASLYNLPLLVEKNLTKVKEAIFPGGSFEQSLKLKVKDFLTKEKAALAVFGIAKKLPKIKKPVKKVIKKLVKKSSKKSKKPVINKKKK